MEQRQGGEAMSASSHGSRIARDPTPDGMPSAQEAPARNAPVFQVRRPDTLQFATLEGLCRMAGVPAHRLRRLIAKEAVDNSCDETDRVGRQGKVSISR